MLAETFTLLLAVGATAIWLVRGSGLTGAPFYAATGTAVLVQGCWFHRLYTAGHEAVHRKMIPESRFGNDTIGQLLLLPLLIPIPVYRKIHKYHHTHNRRDPDTAALDGTTVEEEPGPIRRAWAHLTWYLGAFAGGYFLHGVVSILLFLFLPPSIARKVSPAFERWTLRDQLVSAAIFAVGVGLHAGVALFFGAGAWAASLALPFLVFAWVYSLLVYIYHYRTTYGDKVWLNVRSVAASRPFQWWLLNFNHHRVHHRYPTVPWHMLPDEPAELPDEYADNENVDSIPEAILQQSRGADIHVQDPEPHE